MNLQESIRIILREETKIPTELRRRIILVDRVIDNMLPNMFVCDYDSADHFVTGILDEIIWFKIEFEELKSIERIDIENYILDYKYDELVEYFNERCKNNKLQESIRRILREQLTTVPIRARRRLALIDQILNLKVSNYYGPDKICRYETADELVEVITQSVIETMYYSHYFGDIDDDSEEWRIVYDYMEKYIKDNYGEKLRQYYHINCGD